MIYFDNAASTAVHAEILEEVPQWLANYYANADATHLAGHQSLLAVQRAENKVLELCNATHKASIVWLGTATEALNLGIIGYLKAFSDGEILTTAIEHKAVLEAVRVPNLQVSYLPVDKDGVVDLDQASKLFNSKTRLIAIHHINNEIGVIQKIGELAKLRNELAPKAVIILDASQSFGKEKINWSELGVQMIVATAHKMHGINGTAMLMVDNNIKLQPITVGGGQQQNLRSGTLNPMGIVAFARAFELCEQKRDEVNHRVAQINKYIRDELSKIPKLKVVFHSPLHADKHILSFAVEGFQGAIIMRFLGEKGVIIGTGSACLAEVNSASHVMTALGVSKSLAFATLRLSFGIENTLEEADAFLSAFREVIKEY